MEPAKRLGIYGTILDEQTQREVQYERYYSDVENRSGKKLSRWHSLSQRGSNPSSFASPGEDGTRRLRKPGQGC